MLRVTYPPPRVWDVLKRVLIGVVGSAAAVLVGVPGIAVGDPPPEPAPQPPAPPNVNALAPVKLSEYAVMNNNWYAFTVPDGITCVLQKSGSYGCSGPLPAAPNGANLISGSYGGVPGFANAAGPVFATVADAKPLPAGSRISYQSLSCGNDGVQTTCVDNRSQSGFVLSPAGSFVLNEDPPLLYRPGGGNPYAN
jgi:hypothetical protein